MRTPNQGTLLWAVGRLGLLSGPLWLGYLAVIGGVAAVVDPCLRPLVLGAGLLGLLALGRAVGRCLVKVPPGYAMLVEERWGQEVGAWLGGWHVCPPGIYNCKEPLPLWPRNRERLLENVAVGGSPPLTLKVTYTIRPRVPQDTLILPRRDAAGKPLARDKKIVSNIYFMAAAPAAWDQDSGDLLDKALRLFFGAQPANNLYDLAGARQRTLPQLYTALNKYLDAAFGSVGYEIQVRTVQVLHMDGPGALVWQQRALQQLLTLIAQLPPEQALVAGEVFRSLSGQVPGAPVGSDLALLMIMQMFQRGGGGPHAAGPTPPGPRRPGPPDPWPRAA